jgi:Sulfotransferase family
VTSTNKAPVFVVGSARSGNTMLYHMLLSSGRFPVYRTEPCVFDLLLPRFRDFSSLANRRKLMRTWVRSRQFRRSGLNASEITEKVLSSVTTAGEFLFAVMGEMARAHGFERWAVWGPDNLLYIPLIKRQIPDALFIHVVRDGRDVACALNKKEFIRPFPWDRAHRLYVSALHWMWKVETGRRYGLAAGSDYLEIRFEDLVLQPENTLRKVSVFIGEDLNYQTICDAKVGSVGIPNTSFTEELEAASFSPVGRWKRQLSEVQIERLEGLIDPTLAGLGYPLHGEDRSHIEDRSRSREDMLGFRLRAMRVIYPAFYRLKEWLKMSTALGRFVNVNRLRLDENEDGAVKRDGSSAYASGEGLAARSLGPS